MPTFQAVIKGRTKVNSTTHTLQFAFLETDSNFAQNKNQPKNFYPDIQMIGKHYRISEASNHRLHRHYTIANCLRDGTYAEYLRAMKESSQID